MTHARQRRVQRSILILGLVFSALALWLVPGSIWGTSRESAWMPWELGLTIGLGCAILGVGLFVWAALRTERESADHEAPR